MKRILIIALIIVLLFSGCYHGEPLEPTPEMDFLKEFFTVNKDGRMDAFLETVSQGDVQEDDVQAAIDAYHAGLAPYCEESALIDMENAYHLYLFDKTCTDFSDQWRTMELKATYRDDRWQHQDYKIVLHYPGAGKNVEIKGKFDLNEERKITAFSLDLNTLPGDASSIVIP